MQIFRTFIEHPLLFVQAASCWRRRVSAPRTLDSCNLFLRRRCSLYNPIAVYTDIGTQGAGEEEKQPRIPNIATASDIKVSHGIIILQLFHPEWIGCHQADAILHTKEKIIRNIGYYIRYDIGYYIGYDIRYDIASKKVPVKVPER